MPHNPKKNAAMIPKIAAITQPPIPGPIYANNGERLKRIIEIKIDSITTFAF